MAQNSIFTQERLQLRNQNFLSTSLNHHKSEAFAMTLRKQKRNDCILKKRQKECQKPASDNSLLVPTSRETFQQIKKVLLEGSDSASFLSTLNILAAKLKQNDRSLALKLSKDLNIVKILAETLKTLNQTSEEFQMTFSCILSFTSCPDFITKDLISLGIDDFCIDLLGHFDENIAVNAIWCLSNLSVDSFKLREKMIKTGTVETLLEKLEQLPRHQDVIIWALRNSLEGKESLEAGLLSKILNSLSTVLRQKTSKCCVNSLRLLSLISDKANNVCQLITSSCFKFVLNALDSPYAKVVLPSLRTVGNISAGTIEEAQTLFEKGILDKLYKLFESFANDSLIKKYLCWTLSNLAAGTRSQIELLVAHPVLMKIIKALNDCQENIRKEAMTAVFNIASLGKYESVWALINIGFFSEASMFLNTYLENELTFRLIETISKVYSSLKVKYRFEVIHFMNSSRFSDDLQKLVYSSNLRIQSSAKKLLDFIENSNKSDVFG